MKQYLPFLAAAFLTCIPFTFILADNTGHRSAAYIECESRCSALDEDTRHLCVKKCINAKKRTGEIGENQVKKKINECESLCEQYKGIENVRCRRICLDNKQYIPPQKKDERPKTEASPCESRCGILTGSLKDNCMARCEKKSRLDSRGFKEK